MSEEPSNNRLRSLVGLALDHDRLSVWFVLNELRRSAALQDCYASGRRDCVTIDGTGTHVNR